MYSGGNTIATFDANKPIFKLWDINTGALINSFDIPEDENPIFWNENTIICNNGYKQFFMWDLKSMHRVYQRCTFRILFKEKFDGDYLVTVEDWDCLISSYKFNGTSFKMGEHYKVKFTVNFVKKIKNNLLAVVSRSNTTIELVSVQDKFKLVNTFEIGKTFDVQLISEDHLALIQLKAIVILNIANNSIVHRIERQELYHGDKAEYYHFFACKPDQFAVYSPLYVYVFDAKSFKCISSVCAKVFHENNNIGCMVALKDGLFASTGNNNDFTIFDFKSFEEIIE